MKTERFGKLGEQSVYAHPLSSGNTAVTIIDYAAKPFLQSKVTYDVSIYQVAEGVEVTDELWKLKKTPASKHEDLTKVGTAVIVIDEATGEVLSVEAKPQN